MSDNPTVHIIDDDQAVRDSLQWLVTSIGLDTRCYPSAQDFLNRFNPHAVSCILLDIRLPGMSGLELHDELRSRHITTPVIIITGHGDVPIAVRAFKGGAVDFVEKPFSNEALVKSIRAAIDQDRKNRVQQAAVEQVRHRVEMLTPRERQVMDLVVLGRLNKQIAVDLGLSQKTVEVHRARVMEKMQAASLAGLVKMAMCLSEAVAV
ncbi:MAG: response regulator [Phycisphaera sp.]|nr:response regulator [Phycisphaera sp.]